MGKIIKKKIRGMNLWAKLGVVTALTMFMTVFMYNGWYKPLFSHAATITSTTTGGDWSATATWTGGVLPTAADSVIINGPVTTSAGTLACTALTINTGKTLTMWRPFTVSGATIVNGTINFGSNSGTIRAMSFNDITLNSGSVWNETTTGAAATFTFNGNITNNATTFTSQATAHTFAGTTKTLSGATAVAIPSITFTGNYTNNGTVTAATLLTVTGAAVRLTNNGTITATAALSGTGGVTNGAAGVLNIGGTSGITTLTATAAGNTVSYTGVAQTAKVTTYNNLTLSGSGAKTFATTPTVTGVLSLEGTATVVATTGVVTYGSGATLQYNTATARTASSEEWITPFTASGGIKIANTGVITMNSAETISSTSKLTVNSGSTLALANFGLSLAGNYVGGTAANALITSSGTSGVVTFNGASQSISGSTSWPRLAITGTTARTVTFESGKTQTVTTALTLTGAAGQLLTLAPATAASTWSLVAPATQSVGYVSASYSNAAGGTAVNASAATNVNGGNNTNWTFPVTDTTAPVIGTITITPTIGSFTSSTPTISALITEAETAVTGCDYATAGTNWVAGTVGGSSPTWTCTSPALSGLSGTPVFNVRATNAAGLVGTGVAPISRTVDTTAPVNGTFTATAGTAQNDLSWSGFSDAGVGLSTTDAYKLVFLTGATAPAIKCTNGTDLTAVTTGAAYTHSSLTNTTQYSYRLCAIDAFGTISDGVTATATPAVSPANTPAATNTAIAAAATESASGILMQRLQIDSNTVASSDNAFILNSLTLDNVGTATQIAALKIYLDAGTPSATLPTTAILVGGKIRWSGASTQVLLTGGTDVQRTITAGTSKYLYIVYDMAFGQSGKTVQSHVTALGTVAPPDTSAIVNLSSTSFTLTAGSSASVLTACNSCHATPPVDSTGNRGTPVGSVVGSHTKHATAVCASCHVDPADTTSASFDHRNGHIDFASVGYSKGTSVVQTNDLTGAGLGTCNAASCHDNGKGVSATSPKWGTTAPACTACHALIPGDSHTKHVTSTTFTNKAVCADCHTAYVQGTTANATNHVNNLVNVDTGGYPATKAKGSAFASCTTSYCHSSGQSADGLSATPVYASITWGGSVTCTSCHGATAATLTTGSHVGHLTVGTDCGICHTGATATAYSAATHIDHSITVGVGSYTAGGTAGNGYGTCSATGTGCHAATTTPTWGTNATSASCTKCHGKPTTLALYSTSAKQAAPGYGQSAGGPYTNGVSATPAYGAHDAHLRAVNLYTGTSITCDACHTGAVPASGTHANGTVTIAFNNLAKNIGTSGGSATTAPSARGTLAPAYTQGTTRTCSAVYCHGGVMAAGTYNGTIVVTTGGSDTTPIWTDTAYLTSYSKNVTNCGKCHAALPVVPGKDHSAMVFATQSCNSCHGHEGNGTTHIDGILQASGDCDSCHSYDTVGSVWGTTRYTTHGTWGKNILVSAGAHAKHIDYIKARLYGAATVLDPKNQTFGTTVPKMICGTCHSNSEATDHNTGVRNINFGSGTYQMGSGHANVQTLLYLTGTNPAYNTTAKTCSNMSCHYFVSPAWQ
jgi:predicted CxxxxCH...CXXCH cytochrome family protein